jgi:RHS repeat-associated protein
VFDPLGTHTQQDPNGTWKHILRDGLNSARMVVDNTLSVDSVEHYAPYGEPLEPDPFGSPFMFTGEQTGANGLIYLRNRYYSPSLGVFPSLDPLEGNVRQIMSLNRYGYVTQNPINDAVGEPMSLNRYSYVAGNPTNLVDPSGMIAETPGRWNSCWQQTSDPCSDCMQRWISENVQDDGVGDIWGAYYYAAWLACRDLCPAWYGTPPEFTWRLPMDNAALTADGCLSRRVISTYVPCSRDVNPRGQSGAGHPVYAPSPSGVVWYSGTGVIGTGNVVILRYSVTDLPSHIQNLLPPMPEGGASLFIQYAHLNSDSVTSGTPIPEGLELGQSGATGGDYDPHLDITVIWIPDEAARTALGTHFISPNSSQDWNTLTTNNAAYNARWTIDPLGLWPEMRWSNESLDVPLNLCQPSEACNTYNP